MTGRRLSILFIKVILLFCGRSSAEPCDRSTTGIVQEGNLGRSGDFNWLGVLNVHLHDGDKLRIATTGIILIKLKHALASADDVTRVPMSIFTSDSQVMFLATHNTPWIGKPVSYVTHPEYQFATLNSIAVIELNLDKVNDFPLNPICLPSGDNFNTSRYLYLTGYTDENQILEKLIYKIQYMDKKVCEEFYSRVGLSSEKRVPSSYLCGFAPSNVTQCVWDNGMALVSNVTGIFHLIGFGVHGPGCAAPARFIDLFPYFQWINSVTDPGEFYDDSGYRRREDDDEFVPVHKLFKPDGSRRQSEMEKHDYVRYPFDSTDIKTKHHSIIPEADNAILIYYFDDTWEKYVNACSVPTVLIYQEQFELRTSKKMAGTITYKLSMYDLYDTLCVCVRLFVYCDNRTEATLTFKEVLNYKEDGLHDDRSGETPEEIFQFYGGAKRMPKPKQTTGWEPNPALFKPVLINDDDIFTKQVLNYDLYIRFDFTELAILKFQMLAEPGPLNTETTEPLELLRSGKSGKPTTTQSKSDYNRIMGKTFRIPFLRKSKWGMNHWADKMVREVDVSPVADVEEVTESGASSEMVPGPVVMTCGLISTWLRKAFIIN